MGTVARKIPEVGALYVHRSGALYTVVNVANRAAGDPEKFPVIVVYKNVNYDDVWARPLWSFVKSFSEAED